LVISSEGNEHTSLLFIILFFGYIFWLSGPSSGHTGAASEAGNYAISQLELHKIVLHEVN
jgi:hypothetical protein